MWARSLPRHRGGCDNLIVRDSRTKIKDMASDDDKPRGRGSGGKDRGSGGKDRGSGGKDRPSGGGSKGSGLANRSEPFDEESPIKRKATRDRDDERSRRRASGSKSEPVDEKPAAAEPEAPPRRRFGFRRRSRGADDGDGVDSGRQVASLTGHDLADNDLADDDLADLPEPPRFRRPPWWGLVGGLLLLLIVSFALYGEWNTERFFLVCSGSRAEAHRGRGFPWPFGHRAMIGSQYRPVALGGDTQCQTQELDSEAELRHALLKLLLVQAERLSHKTRSGELAKARQMISQGFLLARNYKKERRRLESLRATLDFQRARVVMRELETTLGEARRLFSKVRRQSKRHDKEAVAWIRLLDRMLVLLRRRVAGDPEPPKRVGAPPASVSPGAMSRVPTRPVPPVSGSLAPDAMKPSSDPPPRRVSPQAPPDAGVSGGGILL